MANWSPTTERSSLQPSRSIGDFSLEWTQNRTGQRQNCPYIRNLPPNSCESIVESFVLGLECKVLANLRYVSTICGLLGDTVYLVYLLLLWLLLRIYRRLRLQARQQSVMYNAKAEGVLQNAAKKNQGLSLTRELDN